MNKDNELFAVGDEDQCIYSFRGSKPEYMVNFHETFKDGVKVKLLTNYRSKNNIVEVSKRLIDNLYFCYICCLVFYREKDFRGV